MPTGLNVLFRVERSTIRLDADPGSRDGGLAGVLPGLATRVSQRRAACGDSFRVAFEIWNEPNLDFQWTTSRSIRCATPRWCAAPTWAPKPAIPRSPSWRAASRPRAAMATAGDERRGLPRSDVRQRAEGHFDAVSIHNYGFGGAPEDKTYGCDILNFRRAEDIYAVMVAHGDGDKSVWGTEFGWLLEASQCVPYWEDIGFAWQHVTAQSRPTISSAPSPTPMKTGRGWGRCSSPTWISAS